MALPRVRPSRLASFAASALGAAALVVGHASPASATLDVDPDRYVAGVWTFDEGWGQTAFDTSWRHNHGTLGESTWWRDDHDPQRVAERWWLPKTLLRFDGDDYVRVGNAPSLEPRGVTVIAKVKAGSSPGAFRYVLAKGALGCEVASYGLYTGANGGLRFYASDGRAATLSADAGAEVWDGRWHTVVGSFDGHEVTLSVDGNPVGSPVPADLEIGYDLPDTNDLYLGDYAGPCDHQVLGFEGLLDKVSVIGLKVSDDTARDLLRD